MNKLPNQNLWIILAITFFGFIGISMPYLIFPPLFLNPSYSFLPEVYSGALRASFLGITLAAYPIGQFIGSPILGGLSDVYGRKRLLVWSLVICGFSNFFSGVAIAKEQLALLIFSRFIAGLMEGNIAIARAMATDIKTILKQKSFGKINAAASIAYLLGPFIGGLLSEKAGAATPFYCISVLFVMLAGLSALSLKKSVTVNSKDSLWQRINLIRRIKNLFNHKQLKFFLLISTFFTLAVDIFYEFGPVFLTMKWTLAPAQLVYYNGSLCVGLIFGNAFLPSYVTKYVSGPTAVRCALGAFAFFVLCMVFLNDSFLMMALFGFTGLAIGLGATLLTVKVSDAGSEDIQGEVMGVQQSLRVLGDGIICLFGGVLLILSSKVILLLAVLITLITLRAFRFEKALEG